MNFQKLHDFISTEMRMSQVYQPVMLIELLRNNGQASVKKIAQAILDKDPTQIEYFSEIVKNMVGRVLTKNRGITEKNGDTYPDARVMLRIQEVVCGTSLLIKVFIENQEEK